MPMVGLAVASRVDEDVGDILSITHLEVAAADLGQGVVACAIRASGVEAEDELPELGAPEARGQVEVLALDVVDHDRAPETQERRDDEPHSFAASWRCGDQDVAILS